MIGPAAGCGKRIICQLPEHRRRGALDYLAGIRVRDYVFVFVRNSRPCFPTHTITRFRLLRDFFEQPASRVLQQRIFGRTAGGMRDEI